MMAVCNWLARALARAQLSTITVGGTWVANDTVTVTINGKAVTFTCTTTTAASATAGLYAALAAATAAEFTEITWATPTSTTITGTSSVGVPFTLTVACVTAGSGTIGGATTTAATGPNHWDNTANWSGAALPTTGDTVNLDLDYGSVLYGLDQSAVTLAALNITGTNRTSNVIGLARQNSLNYAEYRDQYLKVSATAVKIDCQSGRVKINTGTNATSIEVRQTGQSLDTGVPAVLLLGAYVTNVWECVSGSVGIAFYDGETSSGATVRVAQNGSVTGGPGATASDIVGIGSIVWGGSFDDLTLNNGFAVISGTNAPDNITVRGGRLEYRSSGAVDMATVGGRDGREGVIDCGFDLTPRIFTDTTLEPGGRILDPNETIEYTNGITFADGVTSFYAA